MFGHDVAAGAKGASTWAAAAAAAKNSKSGPRLLATPLSLGRVSDQQASLSSRYLAD